MNRILIVLSILLVGCASGSKKEPEKTFADLDQNEQMELVGELNDEFKGNVLIFSGEMTHQDDMGLPPGSPPNFIQLVMDNDNRFAIRRKFEGGEVKTDSVTIYVQASQSNIALGRWSDLGDKVELKLQIGSLSSFFGDKRNKGRLDVVGDRTVQFDKTVDTIWIAGVLCRREGAGRMNDF